MNLSCACSQCSGDWRTPFDQAAGPNPHPYWLRFHQSLFKLVRRAVQEGLDRMPNRHLGEDAAFIHGGAAALFLHGLEEVPMLQELSERFPDGLPATWGDARDFARLGIVILGLPELPEDEAARVVFERVKADADARKARGDEPFAAMKCDVWGPSTGRFQARLHELAADHGGIIQL